MSYRVKEMFATLQGEGVNAGRAAVFCRFTGCNLWSGHEAQRDSAVCRFCDTDFVGTGGPGGGVFSDAGSLVAAAVAEWSGATGEQPGSAGTGVRPLVVFTGGEPMLQLDAPLTAEMSSAGFEVAIETNGTIELCEGIDWVCVSPKAGSTVVVRHGDELKLVHPQSGLDPEDLRSPAWDFDHFLLQPMDGPGIADNTAASVRYCRANPRWRLSLQTHKALGIP
ncbi:MAG: 7-carboxy-7-deazaguanine synthase [Microthrixaceae bacterium]